MEINITLNGENDNQMADKLFWDFDGKKTLLPKTKYGGIQSDFKLYRSHLIWFFTIKPIVIALLCIFQKKKIEKYRYRCNFDIELIRNDIHYINIYFILIKLNYIKIKRL